MSDNNESYKNYEKILQSDPINVPYDTHYWDSSREPRIVHPDVVNLKRFSTTKHLGYAAYHKTNHSFYFTDRKEALLKYVDDELNLKTVKMEVNGAIVVHKEVGKNPGNLKRPVSICINSLGHIFVGDHGGDGIPSSFIIFDSHLNTIGTVHNEHIKSPSCMEIEDHRKDTKIENNRNKFLLYVTDWSCSNLTVWTVKFDCLSGKYEVEFNSKVNVIAPSTVRVDKEHVFVVSEISWVWKNDENKNLTDLRNNAIYCYKREIKRLTSGLNAIIILDKNTLQTIKIIELTNHLNPRGLFINNEGRIFTTVYLMPFRAEAGNRPNIDALIQEYLATDDQSNKEAVMSKFHKERFDDREFSEDMWLIVMNKDGEILQETNLGIEYIGDFLVFENETSNKIVFMSQRDEPALHRMEFMQKYPKEN